MVPVARLNVQVTGYAVYEEPATIAVSHSTKVVGDVAQSDIVAVQTNVQGVGVRRSVGLLSCQTKLQVAKTVRIAAKMTKRYVDLKYIKILRRERALEARLG